MENWSTLGILSAGVGVVIVGYLLWVGISYRVHWRYKKTKIEPDHDDDIDKLGMC